MANRGVRGKRDESQYCSDGCAACRSGIQFFPCGRTDPERGRRKAGCHLPSGDVEHGILPQGEPGDPVGPGRSAGKEEDWFSGKGTRGSYCGWFRSQRKGGRRI